MYRPALASLVAITVAFVAELLIRAPMPRSGVPIAEDAYAVDLDRLQQTRPALATSFVRSEPDAALRRFLAESAEATATRTGEARRVRSSATSTRTSPARNAEFRSLAGRLPTRLRRHDRSRAKPSPLLRWSTAFRRGFPRRVRLRENE